MPEPTDLRSQILTRDGNACVVCGRSGSLELEHVFPRSMTNPDAFNNVVTICSNCSRGLNGQLRYLDFENTLVELLEAHPAFRLIKRHAVMAGDDGLLREIDIAGERRVGGAWQPIRIECKLAGLTLDRIVELRDKLLTLRGDGAIPILAIATDLPARHLASLVGWGIEVWTLSDIASRFGAMLPPDRLGITASLIRARIGNPQPLLPEQLILAELKICPPGQKAWPLYQQLIGRLFTSLFCPPLQTPAAENADAAKENRRDYVFPNYAEAGLWRSLREQYQADFIVVDAKNYNKGVGKREVLQVAHYLKAHGAGLFAMIVSRVLPARDARSAAREAWISQRKLILFLDDTDVESMVLAKAAGRDAEFLIRQKLEDFRLSL